MSNPARLIIPAAELRAIIGRRDPREGEVDLRPGGPYAPRRGVIAKRRIVRRYAELGYPYAEVSLLEQVADGGRRVDLLFTVVQGKRVRFGPVFVRGNFKTRRGVVLDNVAFEPGEPFDLRKLERTERDVRRMGIFNAVRLQVLGLAERRDRVPVVVRVDERHDDHGSIELGAGASTDNLFFASLTYVNRNVLGFGTRFEFSGEAGPELRKLSALYQHPQLFGSPLLWSTRAEFRQEVTERLGEITSGRFTSSLSWTFLRHPDLTLSLRYEVRQVQRREGLIRPAGPVDEASQVSVGTRTAGFGPSLVVDMRDNPLSPRRGARLETSLFWAARPLGGTTDFLHLRVRGQAYVPLPLGITFAVGLRYDHGFPLGGAVVLPKVERFFAGGDSTIRGFEEDRAFAERVEVPLVPTGGTLIFLRPQGGNIRILVNAELEFPLWLPRIGRLSIFGLDLKGAVFIDNGLVTNSFSGFGGAGEFFRAFRHGAGIAFLRIDTGFGAASFEWGWPLDPLPGDARDGRFHFNFGFVF